MLIMNPALLNSNRTHLFANTILSLSLSFSFEIGFSCLCLFFFSASCLSATLPLQYNTKVFVSLRGFEISTMDVTMSLIQAADTKKEMEEDSSDHSLDQLSPKTSGIYGVPEEAPRIGDEYQAQLPQFIEECDRSQLVRNPNSIEFFKMPDSLMGLPISILWIHVEAEDFKQHSVCFISNEDNTCSGEDQVTSMNESETAFSDESFLGMKNEKEIAEASDVQVGSDKMDVDISERKETELETRRNVSCPLPGSVCETWTGTEQESFLLGLYIFGKNLILVKKFVETKGMSDILAFYYGKFYKSEAYRRWTECRKMLSRKVIHGQRIFKGGKQQELLSRLLPHFSEVKQNELLEVYRLFGEDKLSFEEFVFALKCIVGTNMLIEAVGVGKKHDLTGVAVEPVKTARVVALRPELPTGKAWSSLPSGEIIKVLTGDFRLSKARSNDLFWEAVWPRLLTRGWHSEQPKDHGISTLKHTLFFLVPGVKKFSRRELVKGEHYFDSVSDVLNKVAADPRLLELGTEATEEKKCEEPKPSDNSLRKQKRKPHHYLQPRVSNAHLSSVKFMIVDTSLSHNGEGSKVRVMRRLPVDKTSVSSPSDVSPERELEHLSKKAKDEAEETKLTKYSVEASERTQNVGSSDYLADGSFLSLTEIDNLEAEENNLFNQKRKGNSMKDKAHKKVKSSHSNELPFINRCATARRDESSSHSAALSEKQSSANNSLGMSSQNTAGNIALHADISLNISSASSSTKGIPVGKKGVLQGSRGDDAVSPGNPNLQTWIDLNFPHATPDLEANLVMGRMDSHNDLSAAGTSFLTEASQQPQQQQVKSSDAGANGGHQVQSHEQLQQPAVFSDAGAGTKCQQPNMYPSSSARRQSTRNRPLTTKALEALECGFFDTKKKTKRVEALPQYKSMSRSSRRLHQSDEITSSKDVSFFNRNEDSRIQEEGLVGTFRSNPNMVETSQV